MRKILKFTGLSVVAVMLVLALAIVWPKAQAPLPDEADSRLIVDARIVDVENGEVGPPTSVLIRDGKIAAIDALPASAKGLPVLDANGGYLLPGFWDMHSHAFQLSPQMHLPLFIANGITGTRDMMDCPGETDGLIACVADKRRWTKRAAAGQMTSPRFVQIASYYFNNPDMTPDEAASKAQLYKARGIHALKVYNNVSRPTYFRLAAEARRLSMPLVGHLPKAVSLDEALDAGQHSFEHGHLLVRHCFKDAAAWRSGALDNADPTELTERLVHEYDPAACETVFAKMREKGSWFVPTHVTREEDAQAQDPKFSADPRLSYVDPLSRWAFRDDLAANAARFPGERGAKAQKAYFEHGLKLTAEAHRQGVGVLVGTDTVIGGFRFHDEMALMVRGGMTPPSVIKAATIDAARYAGVESRYGSLAVGKEADLVLLKYNPLENISNTRSIEAVLLGGRLYDRKRLDGLLEFVAAQARSPANWAKLVWGFVTSGVSQDL